MNRFVIVVLSVTSSLFLATATYAHDGATGIVKERMDAFSEARGQMKQIRGAIGGSEFDTIAEITARMQIWADKMANYFPEGSDQPPSEAAPTIWSDPDGFATKISVYEQSIQALHAAALSGNRDSTIQAFGALGQSCKSCHQIYRK